MNTKKHNALLIVKSIIFIGLLCTVVAAVATTLQRKDSREKYDGFFDKAGQIDVLLMGSSHVINGINPVKLYENYGYTAYNMGGHGSILPATYWEMMEAFNYCSPKVVVIDTYMLEKDYHYVDEMYEASSDEEREASIEQLHLNMDAWPISSTKRAAIKDLVADEDIGKEFLFDFTLYHNRWEEITADDFGWMNGNENDNLLLGAESRYLVCPDPEVSRPEDDSLVLPNETEGTRYLRKMIEECKSRGIEVALTFLPVATYTDEDERSANTAENIASEYNISYINMENQEDVVNYYTDMNDNGHLNNAGMEKVTAELGSFLKKNFSLEDHRKSDGYGDWEAAVSSYHEMATEVACEQEDVFTELMALENTSDDFFIYIKAGSTALTNNVVSSLISSLSGTDVISKLSNNSEITNDTDAAGSINAADITDAAGSINAAGITDAANSENAANAVNNTDVGGPYLLYHDSVTGAVTEFAGQCEPDIFKTALGDTEYIGLQDFAAIYVNGNEENDELDMGPHYDSDVQILIVDRNNGEIKSRLFFTQSADTYLRDEE